MINVLAALFLIAFEMIPEGIRLRGQSKVADGLEFIYRAVVALVMFSWITWDIPGWFHYNETGYMMIIAGYVLVRFALADAIYNISAKLPVFYIGETKYYDRIWRKFFELTRFPREHFFAMVKMIALLIGLTWLIKY